MLKIKNSVDLKELEKFGFGKCDEGYISQDFSYEMIVDKKSKQISFGVDGGDFYAYVDEFSDFGNVLFDLIQAGLVEKTEKGS